MALTYPLALPAALPARAVRWSPLTVVEDARSPFTLESQVYVHQGQAWRVLVELPPMERADAEQWVGFLLALNGREGTFAMGPPEYRAPRGVATGTPLVKGAGQSGRTLLTDGWTSGVAGILRAGDYFQLGSGASARLHKVVQDAASNGSGDATLEIWPRLRAAPADNAPITVSAPVGVWRLASNETRWDVGTALIYGMAFEAIEAL